MQPADFDKPTNSASACLTCGEKPHPRIACPAGPFELGWGYGGEGIINQRVTRLHMVDRSTYQRVTVLYDFIIPTYSINILGQVSNKGKLHINILSDAMKFWKKHCHNQYRKVIEQILYFNIGFPGEISEMIAEFV